jgi:hypothetical protein
MVDFTLLDNRIPSSTMSESFTIPPTVNEAGAAGGASGVELLSSAENDSNGQVRF